MTERHPGRCLQAVRARPRLAPAPDAAPAVVGLRGVSVGYHETPVLRDVNVDFERGLVHAVVGPNGCGKTTLVRVACGVLTPQAGQAFFEDRPLHAYSARQLARRLAVMWQGTPVVSEMTVRGLATHGRHAHRPWWRRPDPRDLRAVDEALALTSTVALADRTLDELSGGERQRAWLAMCLAQEPRVLVLDEPTTYLDLAHQLDLMHLLGRLNRTRGLTIVMVLHDLSQAARFADRVTVLHDGLVVAQGSPAATLTASLLRDVFDIDARLHTGSDGRPRIDPVRRASTAPPDHAPEA